MLTRRCHADANDCWGITAVGRTAGMGGRRMAAGQLGGYFVLYTTPHETGLLNFSNAHVYAMFELPKKG
jgi:hypothetical protein